MPNTLPVPSKAALRTLRTLALGTSCTVAFTTGLLTEDRRRRIHAAREVHSNAKKLKSSRKYHSVGSPSVESFEEQVMRYRDDEFWQANDSSRTIEPVQDSLLPEPSIPESVPPRQRPPYPFKIWRYEILHPDEPRILQPIVSGPDIRKVPISSHKFEKIVDRRQEKLALDVTRLLQDKRESSNVEAAAIRFFDAFEEGLPVDGSGLRKELIEAAILLSKECLFERNFEAHHKILDVALRNGPIDEDTFFSLGAEGIVEDLMYGPVDNDTGEVIVEESKLRKAAGLYLTKFKAKPRIAIHTWLGLGERLCTTTCRHELFDLTEALYWRLDQCRGDAPNTCIDQLLTALFKKERHKQVVKIFKRLFGSIPLDTWDFFRTGDMVVESMLKVRRLDMAEDALIFLAKASKDRQVFCHTRWFAKVLRSDWRDHHDITRTRELFERLAPNLSRVNLPQGVYGAIIQFCIEAGDENAAQSYFDRLEKAHGSVDAYGVRVLGHFAYAKAMRGDWTGVKEDFRKMWQLAPDNPHRKTSFQDQYSASFEPVFTLFAKTHSVNETEEFLRSFIDYHNVTLKPYMSTTMITKYSEAHEIDSISRWLDYMISVGSPPDPMLFNAIISNCRKKWRFSFDEMYQLYRELREIEGPASNFINDDTFSTLRGIAMAEAGRDITLAARNLKRLNLDNPLKYPEDSRSVQEGMSLALARNNPRRALRIYERAQENLIPLDAGCVTAAVKASLQDFPNDIHAAASLLRKPQIDGLNVSGAVSAIFIHQMTYQYTERKEAQVQDIAKNTIALLEERGIAIRPSIIAHTMHTLVSQGRHNQATEFWDSMSHRQNEPGSLDLPTLTVLLQAYLGVQNCVGVEWTIKMLSVNGLFPDLTFKRALKTTQKELRKLPKRDHTPSVRRFQEVIENAFRTVSAMRLNATNEKEDFKSKAFQIMEKAIEYQKTVELGTDAERGRSRVGDIGKIPSSKHSEGRTGAAEWMESNDESDHIDVPPIGRLVGVHAG